MAVQISSDVPPTEDKFDPQFVATRFVDQYYTILANSPELMHKFYTDKSLVTRKGPNGEMVSMKSVEEIDDEIMSSDYKGCSFDPINLDAQSSVEGGILVALTGNVIVKDTVRRKFYQTFFLATQPTGFFVLNDILRFSDPHESEILPSSNGNEGNASNVPPVHDQEIPTPQPSEVIKDEKVSGVLSDEKESEVKNGDDKLSETNASNIDSKEDASHLDNGKKTSDTKEKLAENGSKDESTLTTPPDASTEQQDTKKISYASVVAKERKVTSPTNISCYKIVRVAPCADKQSIAIATATPAPNNSKKEDNIASNAAAAPENNNGHADVLGPKSIYIANLPQNITKNALVDALKIFGRVRPGGVQIRTFEDGFCYGFVDFELAAFAAKAVEAHNVTVGGNEAYIMFKKSGGSRNGGNGRSLGGNPNRGQDTQESHGNGNHALEDNQTAATDTNSLPQGSGDSRQNEETNWQSHHRSRRGNSKSRQPNGEAAYMRNGYPREERRNGDAYPRRNNRQAGN